MMSTPPFLLVVMGVSGCGKSTFSKAISNELSLAWVDGDDLHSIESVAKMQAGVALNDKDRWPWLDRIAGYLVEGITRGGKENGRVVACSALKRAYRDRIRHSLPSVHFIFLDGDSELIRSRMASRVGHFMRLDLLDSQLRTLERPGADESDVLTINAAHPIELLVKQVAAALLLQRAPA
jgi:gluconokinase